MHERSTNPWAPCRGSRAQPRPCSCCFGTSSLAGEAGTARYPERWVYCSANLQVDQSVKDVIALIERAKKDGYTAMLIADYKLQVLDRVPDFYFRNVEKVKAAAARAGIELVPAVFSVGYSNGHLSHDPNLAEGLPVVDQPFVVKERDGAFPLDRDAIERPRRHPAGRDSSKPCSTRGARPISRTAALSRRKATASRAFRSRMTRA